MDIDTYLSDESRHGRFRGSVLVRRAGKTLLDKGYGLADPETGTPNTPLTAFQIASISKQFNAALILLLQERGALSVHDRIAPWLPRCPDAWQPITIHHLLSHTSGIGHWRDLPNFNLYQPMARDDLIRVFQREPLKFQPGSGWSYSSPGYVLLAHIVEQVTGERYASVLAEAIFRPLGLDRTGAGNNPPGQGERASPCSKGEPRASFELDTVGIGTGDIWSTTGDMARWDEALAAQKLLSAESTRAMFAPHAAVPEDAPGLTDVRYGYGWYQAQFGGHAIVHHPGDNAGFQAINVMVPDDDALVVVLANDDHIDMEKIGPRIVRELLESGE